MKTQNILTNYERKIVELMRGSVVARDRLPQEKPRVICLIKTYLPENQREEARLNTMYQAIMGE